MRAALVLLTLLALVPALAGAQSGAGCGTATAQVESDDTLTGTEGPDTLDGGPGADRVWGLGGDDCLAGSSGADQLDGGDGNDRLFGDFEGARAGAADLLTGGAGSDRLDGGGGDDELDGGPGDDALNGGFGDDALTGGGGHDDLRGLTGADRLDGGEGDDRLAAEGGEIDGGPGNDRISGQDVAVQAGAGSDTVTLGLGASDVVLGDGHDRGRLADGIRTTVDCGPGRDTVTVDRRDRVAGCERVTRRPMPDPRLSRRRGGRRTAFDLSFASPLDFDSARAEQAASLTAEVSGPADRCAIAHEVRRARRGGARERVRLAPPPGGWCRGRHRVQLWYRTRATSSSCDSGELTDEDCRGTAHRIGEALTFRVR